MVSLILAAAPSTGYAVYNPTPMGEYVQAALRLHMVEAVAALDDPCGSELVETWLDLRSGEFGARFSHRVDEANVTVTVERFASYDQLHVLAQRWVLSTDREISVDPHLLETMDDEIFGQSLRRRDHSVG